MTEKIILGTLLASPALYFNVSDFVNPVMFKEFRAIAENLFAEIDEKGEVVLNDFATRQIDYKVVLDLVKYGDSKAFISLCEALKNRFINDSEIQLAQKVINRLIAGEMYFDVLPDIEAERAILEAFTQKKEVDKIKDLEEAYDAVYRAKNAKGHLTGIPTHHRELNELTGGWQRTDLIIVAGRPGMGKTTEGIQFAYESAVNGKPAVFFTNEMSKVQVWQKLASIQTHVPVEKMRTGILTDQELSNINDAIMKYYDIQLFIESGYYNIYKLRNRLRVLKRKYSIELSVIDYLGICNTGKKQEPTTMAAEVARECKKMSSENDCNVTTIALSQLNREVEKRPSKKPQLSDLKQTGEIEEAADMVIFMYRPEYYGITKDEEERDLKGIGYLQIEKHRHGRLKAIEVGFNGRFYDLGNNYNEPTGQSNLINF